MDICNDLEKLNRSYIISKTRIEFLETPVEWQSIRLIKSVVLFSSETISFSPSMFVFLTCTYWGCWSRQVENHRWPLLIQHCCYMLFIPLHRTKSTLKFFSRVGPLKRKNLHWWYVGKNLPKKPTKFNPSLPLISFTFRSSNNLYISTGHCNRGCINLGRKVLVVHGAVSYTLFLKGSMLLNGTMSICITKVELQIMMKS